VLAHAGSAIDETELAARLDLADEFTRYAARVIADPRSRA
jgi:hypothetical protein